MLKKTLSVLCAVLFLTTSCAFAQYSDVGELFGITNFNADTYVGNGASGADFNQDGWDDITTASGGSIPRFFQSNNGLLEEVFFPITIESGASVISVQWIDYDGDNDLDLFYTQYGGRVYLYQNDGNLNLTDVTASSGLGTAISNYYGTSWCDYDRDGDLDVFISKYFLYPVNPSSSMSSKLHRNNGNGTFTDVTISSGVQFIASPTFQGTWLDFDNDGWQDLYIIIDRANYINRLYHNQHNGTFLEVAADVGLALAIDAMSITPGDYDRDNDMDIFVSNGVFGNYFMQNDGTSHFTNIAEQADVEVNAICWGANWVDFDNNGWEDLFIAANYGPYGQYPNFFYTNPGSLPFINSSVQLGFGNDNNPTFCSTLADWNTDGFFDIYNNNNDPFASDFWQNQGGTNTWIGARFHGVQSNTFGVGTQMQVWSNGTVNNRYTHIGEAYLSQNSFNEIVGLGPNGSADSLIIHWPNGLVEHYYGLATNQYYDFVEGATLISTPQASSSTICPNGSLLLSAGNPISVLWNTGSTLSTIEINEPGEYSFTATYANGFVVQSDTLTIAQSEPINLINQVNSVSCYSLNDGAVIIEENDRIAEVNWSSGEQGLQRENLSPGHYDCIVVKTDGCQEHFDFEIIEPDTIHPATVIVDSGLCPSANNGVVIIEDIEGGVSPYNVVYPPNNGQLVSGEYAAYIIDANGCSDTTYFSIQYPDEITVVWHVNSPTCYGLTNGSLELWNVSGGTAPYSTSWADWDFYNLGAGEYVLDLIDNNGCTHYENIQISQPEPLSVDLALEPQIYNDQLGSAEATIFGGTPPYSIFWTTGATEAFISELYAGDYSIQIMDSLDCVLYQDFTITFIDLVAENGSTPELTVYPNPAGEYLNYRLLNQADLIEIHDTNGKVVLQINNPRSADQLNISSLVQGNYILRIQTKKGSVITAPFEVIK